jgi:hypothetical protein
VSCLNLKSKSSFVTFEEALKETLDKHKPICFEKFNRKELMEEDKYHKPDCFRAKMIYYYKIGQDGRVEKLTAKMMHDHLTSELDPTDTGLMF